jgi:hypothetical protein
MPRLCPLLVLLAACSAQPHHEAVPYRFRQSLLLGGGGPGGTSFTREPGRRRRVRRPARRPARPATSSGAAIARRCRGLRGRTFAGPREKATLQLLRACVGQSLSARALSGARLHRDPRVGDVVLFHNTRDANANRKPDDRFTDAGVVIERRGARVRFLYLHPTSGRVRIGSLNLAQPNRRRLGRSARVQNTFLRIKRRSDPPSTRYLAGQLLAGFATWRL